MMPEMVAVFAFTAMVRVAPLRSILLVRVRVLLAVVSLSTKVLGAKLEVPQTSSWEEVLLTVTVLAAPFALKPP